jgi:hypothetical protein
MPPPLLLRNGVLLPLYVHTQAVMAQRLQSGNAGC